MGKDLFLIIGIKSKSNPSLGMNVKNSLFEFFNILKFLFLLFKKYPLAKL